LRIFLYCRVEKNATPWSKERLTELLCGVTIEKGSVKISLTEFKKLQGEATANNRKAKLIFLYEWEIEVKFDGTLTSLVDNG
jgi:activator of HSP90 ATPase